MGFRAFPLAGGGREDNMKNDDAKGSELKKIMQAELDKLEPELGEAYKKRLSPKRNAQMQESNVKNTIQKPTAYENWKPSIPPTLNELMTVNLPERSKWITIGILVGLAFIIWRSASCYHHFSERHKAEEISKTKQQERRELEAQDIPSRSTFRSLVMGRDHDSVIRLIGTPSSKDNFMGSVSWTYRRLTRDEITYEVDEKVTILFYKGRVKDVIY